MVEFVFFPLGRPIRRIFYSAVLGTTAAAICYPKQAVDIALANYDRLKVFVKEQQNKFNQKRAEQVALKELEKAVEQTGISEDQEKPIEELAEVKSENMREHQVEVSEVQEEIPKQEETVEEKLKWSFWSKIPFVDKYIGSKTSDVSPAVASEVENITEAEPSKDQVIIQEESTSEAKPEGDIGQSNPEDKDMYSTRS